MNFLVLSDTHGRPDRIREALRRQTPPPDAIFFLGDGLSDLLRCDTGDIPVYSVRGNCDFTTLLDHAPPPEERLLTLGGITVLMLHGHRHAVKSGIGGAASEAARRGADLLLFGHTHIKTEQRIPAGDMLGGIITTKPLVIFNPGSAAGYDGSLGTIHTSGKDIICGFGEY